MASYNPPEYQYRDPAAFIQYFIRNSTLQEHTLYAEYFSIALWARTEEREGKVCLLDFRRIAYAGT